MTADDMALTETLRLAISDPGATTLRLPNENISAWSARAVERILADRLAAVQHPSPEGANVVQRIVNAWDCCGTCAGGVLAVHVREAIESAEAERDAARAELAALRERVEAMRRVLDDELANLADDGARLSHAVVRRMEAALGGQS
jgi:hypothetical protein